MPRRNGLPHGPSDRGPSRHGRLVDNVVHLTRVRVARVSWSRHGTSGSRPRRPGSLVECGPKDPGPSPPGPRYSPGSLAPSTRHPGLLVDPAVPRTRPRVPRDSWTSPHALGPGHVSPRTAGNPPRNGTVVRGKMQYSWFKSPENNQQVFLSPRPEFGIA